jgi:diguanylate cyclase (GGDEF)-like protein
MDEKPSSDIRRRPGGWIRRTRRWLGLRSKVLARRRSLIGEILALQLVLAAPVGAVALAGLWWTSTWVIEDNMRAWGEQWLDNLDELAVPFYLSDDNDKYERIESYLDKFAEIAFVRYYSKAGAPIFTENRNGADRPIEPLEAATLERIASRRGADQRYLVDTPSREIPIVRVSKPIWAHSVAADGLLGFDPQANVVEEETVGYVELGLNFSSHRAYFVRTMLMAMLIGVGVVIAMTAASWLVYRRALRPLSELQAPLRKLAGGADFSLTKSAHREIVAIANALNATTSALAQRDKKLSELANHDELTGLPNRKRIVELLEMDGQLASEFGYTSALLFVDRDQFRYVNDSVGHSGGDAFLRLAADRLVGGVRSEDIVARFGGDQFLVLLRCVDEREAVSVSGALVRRIQDEPFAVAGRSLTIRCSIGLTMIRGARVKPAKLLSWADMACHYAKANGRNRFHLFDKASRKEVSEMAAGADWAQRIQTALKRDAFVLHYQPIVDLRTRETAYYEVLVRMLGDDGGLVPPSAFLPAASRFGLMSEIDRWVIRQALQSLAKLRAVHRNVRFTINASGSTFERADFFDFILEHLRVNDLPLDAIVIEITEQVAVRNLRSAAARMADLVKRGCRFAIDDFGSGYCSYGYLKELPVAFVKIDGSFIDNLAEDVVDRKIVSAIKQVAEAADCETIAEHVTSNETLLLLEKLGVAYGQGYFLGKPSAEIEDAAPPASALLGERRGPQAEPRRGKARRNHGLVAPARS